MRHAHRDRARWPHLAGDSGKPHLRVDFDRRLKLEFHGSKITSDAGLLAYRELDEVLCLTDLAGAALSDVRRGKNRRHLLTGLLRQSVHGRLAGYEDVNDAERLSRDPAMRTIVDRRGLDRHAASTSRMGRFESPTHGDWEGRAAPRATRPTTGISAAAAIIRSSVSTSSATWNGVYRAPAISTAPRIGGSCWSRWSRVIVRGS